MYTYIIWAKKKNYNDDGKVYIYEELYESRNLFEKLSTAKFVAVLVAKTCFMAFAPLRISFYTVQE